MSSGTTSYNDTGLAAGTTYEFRVYATGGGLQSSASSVASATTTGTAAASDSIWSNSTTPSENAYSWGSYELGVKFTSTEAGEVTGVRFYKQTWMGGYTHIGDLWSSTGTLLAAAVFTGESSYGWQQVNFSSPVAIQANTVYIVSFDTGGGYFGITTGYFNGGGVTSGPLQALSNSTSGGDGVYNSAGSFPDVNGSGMNFWVDVAFTPTAAASRSVLTRAAATTTPTGALGSTAGQWGYFVAPVTTPAPAGPAGTLPGSRGTSAPAGLPNTAYPVGWFGPRRTVGQSPSPSPWRRTGSLIP